MFFATIKYFFLYALKTASLVSSKKLCSLKLKYTYLSVRSRFMLTSVE